MMIAAPPQGMPAYPVAQAPRQGPPPVPMLPSPAAAPAPPAPRMTVRGAAPEAPPARPAPPPRRPLVMPSPDQLGVSLPASLGQPAEAPAPAAPSAETPLDWTAARRRMKELGITGFFVDAIPGGCRFTCWILNTATQQSQRIEAKAASESEAVQLGLDRAAQLLAPR